MQKRLQLATTTNHFKRTSAKQRLLALLCFGLLLAWFIPSLKSQSVQFNPVTRSTIENRLQRTANKKAKSNQERQASLRELFVEAGCQNDRLIEQPVKKSRVPNVICTLPGTGDATIVVGAHFDKVSNGDGAIDNWSGASLLPSLYQSLSAQPRRFTFLFIGFTDEEKGLVGSKFFVEQLTSQQKTDIQAMVNLDSLGLSETKVWVSRADKKLVDLVDKLAIAMHLPLQGMNVEEVGDTDSHSFVAKKIPSIDFHSITQQTLPLLHTSRDDVSAIKLDEYYATYRLLAAYLAFLDTTWNMDSAKAPPLEAASQ